MVPILVTVSVCGGWGMLSIISSRGSGLIFCGAVRTVFFHWLTNRSVKF